MHCLSRIEKKPRLSRSCVGHRQLSRRGTGTSMPPLQKKIGVEPKSTFTDVFDNTCDIGDFRAHIFYQQTTQELPKKHHEAGSPEQLPTDALSQIDYGHTRHCKDCKEVCLSQRTTQKAFWKIWVWVCVCVPPPHVQNALPPLMGSIATNFVSHEVFRL